MALIKLLKKYKIEYTIIKEFPNGVRIGSVYNHKETNKRTGKGNRQAWFPKSWTKKEILRAATHMASLKKNRHKKPHEHMLGVWKGVNVIVVKGKRKHV